MFEGLKKARQRARDRASVRTVRNACRMLMSERGTANSVKFAAQVIEQYEALSGEAHAEFVTMLAEEFSPDPQRVLEQAHRYAETRSAESLVELFNEVEPPRQELLRRINRAPRGAATLLRIRTELLRDLKQHPELAAVEADFHHLLSSWYDPGFLKLACVDWHSPAHLLEQIIHHEAVHAIRDWGDLRRRLQPDRRCFTFLHPILPEDLLIFVEVALVNAMPDAIAPLIDGDNVDLHPERARCAVFYSISNCQPGLRGVSLGNFLIKQVCETLKTEFPRLTRFCTLSPMPGFASWLRRGSPVDAKRLPKGAEARVNQARNLLHEAFGDPLQVPELAALEAAEKPVREALLRLGGAYLLITQYREAESDPVASFHLGNGARIERLNYLANRSTRGLRESCGLMVNYVYDLPAIERCHENFVAGKVEAAREVLRLV
ncbi:MAG: malonyl-CoA decarboxylase [Betaproteobacteria bacterium]|nr:malonyl-CoA decarboxylase [Betaproteobacteria bacterium]